MGALLESPHEPSAQQSLLPSEQEVKASLIHRARSKDGIFRHPKDPWLLAYQVGLYAILLGIWAVFSRSPWWLQICLFWIGGVMAGRNEAVLHWAVHTPVFRSKKLNQIHRICFSVVPPPALLYRHQHRVHHRYDNAYGDDSTTLEPSKPVHQNVFSYVFGNVIKPGLIPLYREMSASEQLECRISLGVTLVLWAVLMVIDPYATLVYWIPVTTVMATLTVWLANYTDHVPGDPGDSYLQATYAELRTPYDKFISLLDMHNSAYHLTHHRHPEVHWADLGRLHDACIPQYKAHGSPLSLAVNSTHLCNPFAFALMIYRVHRDRDAVPVTSVPKDAPPGAEARPKVDASEEFVS